MSLATLVERYGRAILTSRSSSRAAGVLERVRAAEQHLSAARVPAHRRHRPQRHASPARSMMLTVTRPIEQAIMEVPGHPARALAHLPRRHRDLGAVRSRDRHDRGAAAGAEPASPRSAAIAAAPIPSCTIERLTPAAFPVLQPQPDRRPAAGRPVRLRVLRRCGRRSRACRASATSRCWRATRARSKSSSIRRKLTAAGLTVDDVADALKAPNQLQPVGRYSAGGLQHLVLASGLWKTDRGHRRTRRCRQGRRDAPRVRPRPPSAPARPIARRSSPATGRRRGGISVSQQIGANILDVRAGRRDGARRSRQDRCRPACKLIQDLRPRRVRRRRDRQRPRRDPHRRRPRGASCCSSSCATGG